MSKFLGKKYGWWPEDKNIRAEIREYLDAQEPITDQICSLLFMKSENNKNTKFKTLKEQILPGYYS